VEPRAPTGPACLTEFEEPAVSVTKRSCDVEPIGLDTVEFVYRGHVAAADLLAMVEKYKSLRESNGPEKYNIVDTLAGHWASTRSSAASSARCSSSSARAAART
jgi:hypothetical protein